MASIRQLMREVWDRINPPLTPEQRAVYAFDVYGDSDVGVRTASGARVNEELAFKYSVAFAAMTLIADGVSGLEPEARRTLDDGSKEAAELPKWILRPHPEQRRFDLWNQIMLSVLAWGNAYAALVRRPSDLEIIGLEVLDPSTMTVEWDQNKPFARRYRQNNTGPWYSSFEIMHIQGPTLPGEPAGMSVIAAARESIGLGFTLEEFGARYFGQGSQAKIVLEIPTQVDDNEAARLIKQYERFHRGRNNWHRPAIMSGGAKLHNISIPPEDAQFLESRQFQAIDVARWFRVPPHRVGIIGVQTSWGSGLAEENLAMLQHTFRPWILRVEEALSWYTPNQKVVIHLNTEDLLHGTFEEQAEVWSGLYLSGIITKDEARLPLGLPKAKEGGDEFFEPQIMPGEDAPKTAVQQGPSAGIQTDKTAKEKDRKRKQNEK